MPVTTKKLPPTLLDRGSLVDFSHPFEPLLHCAGTQISGPGSVQWVGGDVSASWSGAAAGAVTSAGDALSFGGSSYLSMGADIRLIDKDRPFTLAWAEIAGSGIGVYPGIASFFPAGATYRFVVGRSVETAYGPVFFGTAGPVTSVKRASTSAVALTTGVLRRWLIVGRKGMHSQTNADFDVYLDGVKFGVGDSKAFSNQSTTLNIIGWDGANNNFTGSLLDVTLFGTAFAKEDAEAYFADPHQIYVPRVQRKNWSSGGAITLTGLTMSNFTSSGARATLGITR